MSLETNITAEKPRGNDQLESSKTNSSAEYRWIRCVGCEGEIGVPATWEGDTADCPQCGAQVRVNGWLQYRPPSPATPLQAATAPASIALPAPPVPSLELRRKADTALTFGILCIFFGWTVLIPLLSLIHFFKAKRGVLFNAENDGVSALAKKEGVPVPVTATIGLILTLVFGGMQTIALVVTLHCNRVRF